MVVTVLGLFLYSYIKTQQRVDIANDLNETKDNGYESVKRPGENGYHTVELIETNTLPSELLTRL